MLFLSEQFGMLVKYERCSRKAGRWRIPFCISFLVVRTTYIYKMESYSRAFEEYATWWGYKYMVRFYHNLILLMTRYGTVRFKEGIWFVECVQFFNKYINPVRKKTIEWIQKQELILLAMFHQTHFWWLRYSRCTGYM